MVFVWKFNDTCRSAIICFTFKKLGYQNEKKLEKLLKN